MLDYSDADVVEELMLDVKLQNVLHTTSFKKQPLSGKGFQNFRKRCYQYEQATGNDLMHTCIESLPSKIAEIIL